MVIRRLIALFLAVTIVFPMILATLSVISVTSWALDREFYVDLLGDERLYEVMLSEEIPRYLQRETLRGELGDVPVAALTNAVRAVVTPEYLRNEAVRIVDQVFDALEGESDGTIDIFLDLTPIKESILAKAPAFAQAYAAELPTCASGQEATFTVEASGRQTATLYQCVPSDSTVEQVADDMQTEVAIYLDEIPDRVDLGSERITVRNDFRRGFVFSQDDFGFFDVVSAFNFSIFILLALSAVIWLITAFIGGASTRSRYLWLGWTLMTPALLVFFIGLAVNFAADPIYTSWFRSGVYNIRFGNAPISDESALIMIDVFRSTLDTVANGFLASGAVSGAIALGLLALGWSSSRVQPMSAAMAQAPVGGAPSAPARPASEPEPSYPDQPSTEAEAPMSDASDSPESDA